MKVYLLIHNDCEHYDEIAIYSTKELADQARSKLDGSYFIEESEVLSDSSIPLYGIK